MPALATKASIRPKRAISFFHHHFGARRVRDIVGEAHAVNGHGRPLRYRSRPPTRPAPQNRSQARGRNSSARARDDTHFTFEVYWHSVYVHSVLVTINWRAANDLPRPSLVRIGEPSDAFAVSIYQVHRSTRIEQAAHVADGKEAAEHGVAGLALFTFQHRHVVGAHRALEADLAVGLHRREHIESRLLS